MVVPGVGVLPVVPVVISVGVLPVVISVTTTGVVVVIPVVTSVIPSIMAASAKAATTGAVVTFKKGMPDMSRQLFFC